MMSVSSLASSVIVNKGGLAMLVTVMRPESQEYQRRKCSRPKYKVYLFPLALILEDASRTFQTEYMVLYSGPVFFTSARLSER